MISYQLYSSRNFGAPADAVRRVADLGYRAVEGYGALFESAGTRGAVASALAETGTAMPTAHVGLASLEDDPDIAAVLSDMGATAVFVPFVAPGDRPSDTAGWRALADRTARAGKALRTRGLRLGWHNHDFEFAPLPDGSIPMEYLLSADLDWQFDIAWAVRAGADPMGWIARYGDRITAVHVKDLAPEGERVDEDGWADPGTGTMDWTGLSRTLSATGAVRHWIMEHDNPSDEARFAKAGLAMARTEGLA